MEAVWYTSGTDAYVIYRIETTAYVYEDVKKVEAKLCEQVSEEYIEAMHDSVMQGLAYTVVKNGERVGFVYNRMKNGEYYGASICIWDQVGMFLCMRHMFEICDAHKITFIPHGDNWKYFKSMVHGSKLRMLHNGDNVVTITKENASKEGERLYRYFGIEKIV